MSHVPHAFQPPAHMPQSGPVGFNPRHAMRPSHHAGYAPAPHGHAPYPQAVPYGVPPQAMGVAPAQAYAPYSAPHQPGPQVGPPQSKKEARRAARAQKAFEKQQKKAAKKSSPLMPFLLGLIVGAIVTTYLSNSLFATQPLEGPAWTLPSAADVPLAEAVPDEDVLFDEAAP